MVKFADLVDFPDPFAASKKACGLGSSGSVFSGSENGFHHAGLLLLSCCANSFKSGGNPAVGSGFGACWRQIASSREKSGSSPGGNVLFGSDMILI